MMQNINCDIILFVGKIMMIVSLILLGLFAVYVINNNIDKPKPAVQEALLNNSSAIPSPSQVQNQTQTQTQALNITPSVTNSTSSPNSSTSKVASSATVRTSKGDIEISFYSKEAPNTVANFASKAKSGFYNNLVFHRVELSSHLEGGNSRWELNNSF